MSAALQLPMIWGVGNSQRSGQKDGGNGEQRRAAQLEVKPPAKEPAAGPVASLAFYRKHTEKMLRRYLYASMQVGRRLRSWAIRLGGDGSPAGRFGHSRTR